MFNVLPFGLSSAPYIFTKCIDRWSSAGGPDISRRGQSIKIDIGKPLDKSITIDINHVNVIDCNNTHNSSGNYCYRGYRFYRWMSINQSINQ